MTFYMIYDGHAFFSERPIQDLAPNTRVRVIIEPVEEQGDSVLPYSALDVAAAANLEGPPDWAEHPGRTLVRSGVWWIVCRSL